MAAINIWHPIKDLLIQGKLPARITEFNMPCMVEYFVATKGDMRAIRDQSYQMFFRGHVHVCKILSYLFI